jgi:hypothetical protein
MPREIRCAIAPLSVFGLSHETPEPPLELGPGIRVTPLESERFIARCREAGASEYALNYSEQVELQAARYAIEVRYPVPARRMPTSDLRDLVRHRVTLAALALRLARQSPVMVSFVGYEGLETNAGFGIVERCGRWLCHPSAEHNQYDEVSLRRAKDIFSGLRLLWHRDRAVRRGAMAFHPPNRLVAAMRYFQLALAQFAPDARFIFLVVALEALLTTGPTGITRSFSRRLAAAADRAGYVVAEADGNAIYNTRSRLVHGELLAEEMQARAQTSATHAESACHAMLAWLITSPALRELFGVRCNAPEARTTRRFIESLRR